MSNNNEHIVPCESNIQVIPPATEQQWRHQDQNNQPQQIQVGQPQYYIPQYAQYTQQNYQNNNQINYQQQTPIQYYYQQPQNQIPIPQPQPQPQQPEPLPVTLIQDAEDDARKQFNFQSALHFALPQVAAYLACLSDYVEHDLIEISWNYRRFKPQFYVFISVMVLTLVCTLTCPKRVKNQIWLFYGCFVISYALVWQGIFSSSFYHSYWDYYYYQYYFGRYMLINMTQIVFVMIGLCCYLKKHSITSELSKSLGYLIAPAWVIYVLALMFAELHWALLAVFSILASAIGFYVLFILQQINKKGILNLMTSDTKSIGLTIHILLFSPVYDIGSKLE